MVKYLGIKSLIILSLAMILYLIGHMIFALKDLEGWYIILPSAGVAIVSIFLFMLGLVCDLLVEMSSTAEGQIWKFPYLRLGNVDRINGSHL